MNQNSDSTPQTANERFAATRWSLVAAAGAHDPTSARRALIELCLRYWYPVYAYVRGCGHAPEVAQGITQGFFEHLLATRLSLAEVRARGRFREHLLESLNRFLGGDWRQPADARPVPEFEQPLPWSELEARFRAEAASGLTPEQNYQRSYALEVLAIALTRLRQEAEQAGRTRMFDAMQAWLSAEPLPGQMEQVARELGIRPLAAVVALKRLRQRFRELAEHELSETVSNAADLQAEREALARALAHG
jgi:hypothetical protein